MARVLRLHEYTGISGIQLDDLPTEEPGAGEIRIRVDAFSLNYGDFDLFDNQYMFTMALPARFGDECAGTVDALGPGVTEFSVGDAVSTLPWMNEGYGVNGEFAIVPTAFASRYPAMLSPEAACCIWVAHLTAYYALVEIAEVKSGDWVLITAGSSSAGLAAMELCRMKGARSIATSRSTKNLEYLRDVGFDHALAQSDGPLAEQILACTGGEGTRVVYDPVGGRIVQDYAKGLAQNAVIFLYGGMDGHPTVLPEVELTQRAACLRPYSVYNHVYDKTSRQRGIEFVSRGLRDTKLSARVDKVYPLSEFRTAFEDHQRSTARRGKLVITTQG